MSQKFEKLKTLLKELFQLDQPDLDFGLYRIMHAKSAEVTQFLDKDLLPQVKQAFGHYKTADKAELEKELAKAIEQAQSLGADPETSAQGEGTARQARQRRRGYRRRWRTRSTTTCSASSAATTPKATSSPNASTGRASTRSLRGRGGQAPLGQPRPVLHQDQRVPARLRLPPAARRRQEPDARAFPAGGCRRGRAWQRQGRRGQGPRLHPRRSGATSSPRKTANSSLRFEYRPATLTDWPEDEREGKKKPPAQKDLIALAVKRILAVSDAAFAPWIAELAKPHVTVDGENADHTRLEGHCAATPPATPSTISSTKILGGFLRRELDFYVKNEVMHLDDIENETAPRVEQYLSKIKVIRRIAGKIIDFLAQLEDFQKKLWLKKKFVVETQYCITLDRIPEEFYPEIAANDAQREEWVRLFAIDEIKGDLMRPAYTKPLTVEFLKAHPTLMVDTRHFDADFKSRLLDAIDDLDNEVDGVCSIARIFKRLSLMQARYCGQVKCIYIDPPYNTDASAIIV